MTKLFMERLYLQYYTEVVPECERTYRTLTGSSHIMTLHRLRFSPLKWLRTRLTGKRKRHDPLPYFSRS
ncbi:hypothetical protein D3C83_135200 [compost metagenome]